MPKNPRIQAPKSRQHGQAGMDHRRVQRVTPTSERIIKETSVKWWKAIEVLSNH